MLGRTVHDFAAMIVEDVIGPEGRIGLNEVQPWIYTFAVGANNRCHHIEESRLKSRKAGLLKEITKTVNLHNGEYLSSSTIAY